MPKGKGFTVLFDLIKMSLLTIQNLSDAGLTPTTVAAGATGDSVTPNGRTVLFVANTGVVPITVTITSVQLCSQGFTHNVTSSSISAGASAFIWLTDPANPNRFINASGQVAWTYSATAGVQVAAVQIP